MQRDITKIRRDIKESDTRVALSYEQSEQRSTQSRAKIYVKADDMSDQIAKTGEFVQIDQRHDGSEGGHCRVDTMEAHGARSARRHRHGRCGRASFIAAYWHDIWRMLRGS